MGREEALAEPPARRAFFGLWPDAPARSRLAAIGSALAERSAGRVTPADKIHLTLAFLGEVAPERLQAAREIAAGIRGPIFRLRLDRAGSFRRSRIGWAGCESVPDELLALQGALAAALRGAGFALEERAYSPHVTLVRRIERAIPAHGVEAVEWEVRQFALVRSDLARGRYETVASWPLG